MMEHDRPLTGLINSAWHNAPSSILRKTITEEGAIMIEGAEVDEVVVEECLTDHSAAL